MNKHHVWSYWLYAPWVTLFIIFFSNLSNSKDSHVNKIIDITNYHTYLQVWTIYQFFVSRLSNFHSKKMCIVQIYCLHHAHYHMSKAFLNFVKKCLINIKKPKFHPFSHMLVKKNCQMIVYDFLMLHNIYNNKMFIQHFVGPYPHRRRDYHIGSHFWKFYLVKTSFTLGEPISLVKMFRLLTLEWIVLMFWVWI